MLLVQVGGEYSHGHRGLTSGWARERGACPASWAGSLPAGLCRGGAPASWAGPAAPQVWMVWDPAQACQLKTQEVERDVDETVNDERGAEVKRSFHRQKCARGNRANPPQTAINKPAHLQQRVVVWSISRCSTVVYT